MHDNIWFTYKARIQAHHRLEWLEKHSQFILVWYAILSAVLSIVTLRFPKVLGDNTDVVAAILSVALLGISLIVSNLDFRGRAIAMRRNYIALQRLYFDITTSQQLSLEQKEKYFNLLNEVENHRDIDDKISRVTQAGLKTRIPTQKEKIIVILWILLRIFITAALYILPLIYLWIDYDCKQNF
ncbi:SLATT domain-containing protein [Shigella sonnei]|uniref:SLATT domain-containing protein n=1 Tax=Escherichia coli TaxID=562 RepID=UPI000B7FFAC1|nr:SLATT domain-containing protein [Escherichia coli]EFX0425942.1 SLATT domain-containing protein [Shigella sonnei]HAN3574448.1 SLATT domain-containing protein [Escherichia coli O25b:H4-ST131]EFB2545016.1 SLATT domain-containing protein [Escherichia coli]EFZ5346208.1 SLATT domain-containing protein [Shigella sonnei]EGE1692581.1 SLATT domain-containing protein [Shigella sonnei]